MVGADPRFSFGALAMASLCLQRNEGCAFIATNDDAYDVVNGRKLPGNGAFVHSCYTHCEAQGDDFFTFAINGTTMQQAVSRWWNSDGNEPAQKHTYAPCLFQTSNQSAAWQCNPTC